MVYVTGFAPDCTEAALVAHFAAFNPVGARVARRNNGRTKGFAFVEFASATDQQASLALHGSTFGERTLVVQLSSSERPAAATSTKSGRAQKAEKRARSQADEQGSGKKSSTIVYVTNLPMEWNDEALQQFFAPYSPVAWRVARRSDGTSKAFGFVELATPENQRAAIEALANAEVDGRKLGVEASVSDRPVWPDGRPTLQDAPLDAAQLHEMADGSEDLDAGGEATKKVKTDGGGATSGLSVAKHGPTRVVHVRGLPFSGVAPDRFVALAKPWSPVERIVELRPKGQAFLQLKDVESAVAMVAYYDATETRIDGRLVQFQGAPHRELAGGYVPGVEVPDMNGGGRQPSRAVLVRIVNCTVPITIEAMHSVFQLKGCAVVRMVLFIRDGLLHCLAEMPDVDTAVKAVRELHGQCIYSGCCQMMFSFAKDKPVTVAHQSERQRDFVNVELPYVAEGPIGIPPLMPGGAGMMPMGGGGGGGERRRRSRSRSRSRERGGRRRRRSRSRERQRRSRSRSRSPPHDATDYIPAGVTAPLVPEPVAPPNLGRVLMVSNLLEEKVNVHVLFVLFGCFGDVEKAKILFDRRSAALVQFTSVRGAAYALQHLNNVEVFGRPMRVSPSTNSDVNMSKESGGGLSENFGRNHVMHRYGGSRGDVVMSRLSPVCSRLYVTGVPVETSEEALRALFAPSGAVERVQWLGTDTQRGLKACFVFMRSPQDALTALVTLHWHPVPRAVGEAVPLRVSFSLDPSATRHTMPSFAPDYGMRYPQQQQQPLPPQQPMGYRPPYLVGAGYGMYGGGQPLPPQPVAAAPAPAFGYGYAAYAAAAPMQHYYAAAPPQQPVVPQQPTEMQLLQQHAASTYGVGQLPPAPPVAGARVAPAAPTQRQPPPPPPTTYQSYAAFSASAGYGSFLK